MNGEIIYYLAPLFFVTALVYASVGLGGGSTYLALLTLINVPYASLPKVALLCNLVVVGGGVYHYVKTKNLSLNLVAPFVITSIPLAYLGGRIPISRELFLALLGLSLAAVGLRMLFLERLVAQAKTIDARKAWVLGFPTGGAIGFLSGLVGIGGGIFLSPLMHFLGWGNPKQIAASASFFILVNSLFGLLGQWRKADAFIEISWLLPLMVAVWIGGQIGSRLSVGKFSSLGLQRVTAVVVLIAAGRIFWRFLWPNSFP